MAREADLPKGFEKIDFKEYGKKAKTAKGRIRCWGMQLLQKGKNISEVAEAIGQSRQAIHTWLKWIREEKIERLVESVKGRGQKGYLGGIKQKEIIRMIEEAQEERKGGRCTWKDFSEEIQKRWGKKYKRSGIYDLLKRIGMSWVTARSKHPKMDPKEQETFKKTSGKKLKKSSLKKSKSTKSKSGSKTNTESVNKEA